MSENENANIIEQYCIKCKKNTPQEFKEKLITKNNRLQNVYQCQECGLMNRRFLKKQ